MEIKRRRVLIMTDKKRFNSYELSRAWFDFCFENPEKIKPNHTAIYFFCVEHCNRLGWKRKFGLPTSMVKDAVGIRSYNTYKKTLDDLVEWGFIEMIEYSKNQYSSNIIALSNFDKALNKALDKALIKHSTKQSESTVQSIDSIIKQINNRTINKEQMLQLEIAIKSYHDKKEESLFSEMWEKFPYKKEFGSCCKLFDDKNLPKTESQKVKWITDFRLLVEKDSYTPLEIYNILKWARGDDFWKANTLSFLGLRKKKNGVMKIDNIKAKYTLENKPKENNQAQWA